MEDNNIKKLNFNVDNILKHGENEKIEITEIKYQGEPTEGTVVFSVFYTDKNFSPNNKYIFYYPTKEEIELTDGTEISVNLKQRIQYEIYKHLKLNQNDNDRNTIISE